MEGKAAIRKTLSGTFVLVEHAEAFDPAIGGIL
jgi:hypothetical protein